MTDFDAALERLISDPAFRDELATDPARALAGYRLSPDELDLLRSQVDTGAGDSQRQVETRTSKASLFGLLSPMGGLGDVGDAVLNPADTGGQGGGGVGSFLTDHTGDQSRSGASFGAGEGRSGASFGAEEGRSGASFGSVEPSGAGGGQGGGEATREGASFGTGDGASQASFGDQSGSDEYRPRHGGEGLGAAVSQAGDFMGDGGVEEEPRGTIYSSAAAQEYTTRVDADGDGRWDDFTVTNRADGGVDLSVDRDGDGNAEFIGHDLDRDGLIDEATTDTDGDGVLDTQWVDTDGDGWLDERRQAPAYEAQRSEIRDPRAQ